MSALQLAKASALALVSMLVIIITVITQGATVPSDLRGDLKGELFINSGFFQAVGVISFGKAPFAHFAEFSCYYSCRSTDSCRARSICLPPQLPPDLWISSNAYNRPLLYCDALQHLYLAYRLPHDGALRLPHIRILH
jgi:hypothetical protein